MNLSAVEALYSLGKQVTPELIAVIANLNSTELVRRNAAQSILLLYRATMPDPVVVLATAARAQSNPSSYNQLMEQAKWAASRCSPEWKNDCENALVK